MSIDDVAFNFAGIRAETVSALDGVKAGRKATKCRSHGLEWARKRVREIRRMVHGIGLAQHAHADTQRTQLALGASCDALLRLTFAQVPFGAMATVGMFHLLTGCVCHQDQIGCV